MTAEIDVERLLLDRFQERLDGVKHDPTLNWLTAVCTKPQVVSRTFQPGINTRDFVEKNFGISGDNTRQLVELDIVPPGEIGELGVYLFTPDGEFHGLTTVGDPTFQATREKVRFSPSIGPFLTQSFNELGEVYTPPPVDIPSFTGHGVIFGIELA